MRILFRFRRLLFAAAAVAVLLAAVTARLFVWPSEASVKSVDAVVVLSGDFGDRVERALQLMADEAAPVLVHAGQPDTAAAVDLCEQPQAFEVVCLLPDPDNTRTEARAVGELARERGWDSIAVVTTNFHVTRAGVEFRRCVDGRVTMVPTVGASGRRFHARQIPREWVKVLAAQVLHRRC